MPLEHSNDKWVAFAWPQRIAQQCEDTEGLLKQSRGLFQEEVWALLLLLLLLLLCYCFLTVAAWVLPLVLGQDVFGGGS